MLTPEEMNGALRRLCSVKSPNFNEALAETLRREGYSAYTNDPDDPGGATRYGVSLRFLKKKGIDINDDGSIDVIDVDVLNRSDAERIYNRYWWTAYRYGSFTHHVVAAKVFDSAINMGPRQAHLCLQRACTAAGESLAHDGILGPKSRRAVEMLHPALLIPAYRSELAGFYRLLGVKKYLQGWLRRAYDM